MIGNFIDLIIIFFLLIEMFEGLRRRNSDIIASIISVAAALTLSFLTYGYSASFLEKNFQLDEAYARVVGFFLNAIILKALLILLFERLYQKIKAQDGEINLMKRKIGGALLSLTYGIIKVFVLFSILISLTLPGFIRAQIESSTTGGFVKRDPIHANARFNEVFGGMMRALLRDLDFMSIKTGTEEKVDLGFQILEVKEDPKEEEEMLKLVNRERTSRGLKPLVMDEEARKAARDYGKYLFENGIFSHIDLDGKGPGDRLKNYNTEFTMAGENLAYAPELAIAHQGLMDSQGHRENILHPFFGRIGIGVIDGGSYGKIYVQEFMD
jgi:uncharacterized protein YkwD